MPIIKPTRHSAPVFYPKTDYTIVKYLDLTKYISLLQKKSLFFCRLDKLEDQFEGTTAKPNFESRVNYHKYLRDVENYFTVEVTDEDIIKTVKEQYEHEKKLKAINCVNCWNKKEQESAALWKIYSDFSKGIMIKSSISRLKRSLANAKEEIKLSEIHYLDYDNEPMPDGNTMYPLIHKHNAYSYEDEVRLINQVNQDGWIHDWSKEEVFEGIFIETNINYLIREIIISPYSPRWFFDIVQDLSKKYGLEKQIKKSTLSLEK